MRKPPKLNRKELKKPDEFVTVGQKALRWLAQHKNKVLPLLVLIGVSILGNYGYKWWVEKRMDDAWQSYNLANKLPEPQRWEDLKTVFVKWEGLRPSLFAAVTIADFHYGKAKDAALKDDKKVPEVDAKMAAEWYGNALTYSGLLATERQLLQINKGNAMELMKKYDEALKVYEEAANMVGESKALALLNVARAYQLKEDLPKAMSTYEQITKDFADTEYAKLARNYLRRLKSPLFGNAKS